MSNAPTTGSGYASEAEALAAGKAAWPNHAIRTFHPPSQGWTWLRLIEPGTR